MLSYVKLASSWSLNLIIFGNNWYDFLADICVAGYNEFNYMQLYKIVYVYDDAEKKLYLSF
jgi:hypothetical protein